MAILCSYSSKLASHLDGFHTLRLLEAGLQIPQHNSAYYYALLRRAVGQEAANEDINISWQLMATQAVPRRVGMPAELATDMATNFKLNVAMNFVILSSHFRKKLPNALAFSWQSHSFWNLHCHRKMAPP